LLNLGFFLAHMSVWLAVVGESSRQRPERIVVGVLPAGAMACFWVLALALPPDSFKSLRVKLFRWSYLPVAAVGLVQPVFMLAGGRELSWIFGMDGWCVLVTASPAGAFLIAVANAMVAARML
jgi:hypothetical protein